jgi:hypothetical protein
MNDLRAMLTAAGLCVAFTGAMGTAQADEGTQSSVTLYTSAIHTGVIACNAVNVRKKTLHITISIVDGTGPVPNLLAGPTLIQTPPGPEATVDVGAPTDDDKEGYCVFQVSGTRNRDDVRAVQNAVLAGTRSVDGGKTTFPFFITRVLEAH